MNQSHIYLYPFPFGLPIQVTTVPKVEFPVLYNVFSLVTYFTYRVNSVYVSMPVSQFLLPTPCFPLGIHPFVRILK